MKKPLFNEYSAYNADGIDLSTKFESLIRPFVVDAMKEFNPIEVEYILMSSLNLLCCMNRIRNSLNKRQEDVKKQQENQIPEQK